MENEGEYVKDNSGHKQKKLLDVARDVLRRKHYSIRTEEAYTGWMLRYILFHNKRHPKDMRTEEIEAFLTHLAVDKNVSASTQNQALNAPQGFPHVSVKLLQASPNLFWCIYSHRHLTTKLIGFYGTQRSKNPVQCLVIPTAFI